MEKENIKAEDIAEFKRANIWERFSYVNDKGQDSFNIKGAFIELDQRARLAEEALGYIATCLKEWEESKTGPKIIGLNDNKIIN